MENLSNKISNKIERYKKFFKNKSSGQILGIISPYTFNLDNLDYSKCKYEQIEQKPLDEWDFEEEAEAYIDSRVKGLRCFLEYTEELDSDFIPTVWGYTGIGPHSAYFSGADVKFSKDTSWVDPVIKDWEDMDKLSLSQNNKWFKIIMRMVKRTVELCEGDYIPGLHSHFGPSDMANALRGNKLFYVFGIIKVVK